MTASDSPRARRFAHAWHRAECWIALASLTLIAILLIIDVFGRELFAPLLSALGATPGATGVPGAQRIAVYALVVGAFCGIGIATATNAHLVPRVGFGWLPASWSGLADRVADAFTGAFALVVAWYGLQFVLASKGIGMRAPVLGWEVWPFQLAIPAGFASAALRYLLFAAWPALKPPRPEFQE